MNTNYQKILDSKLEEIEKKIEKGERPPRLLLHSCCAPCSSYVLEYLSKYFEITVLYYNPNISEEPEYRKRVDELKRLINEIPTQYSVLFVEGDYVKEDFERAIKGKELLGERSERCYSCYYFRMEYAAQYAKKMEYDYFTTTLSISPHKNAAWINEIGADLSEKYDISYLFADFKKRNGYKRSIELSEYYHLYRQDYCGCVYSKKEKEENNK